MVFRRICRVWSSLPALIALGFSRAFIEFSTSGLENHVKRPLPGGYQATVETGQNQLKDPKLAKLYDQIQLITTGPLWSWQRLQAIWKLNTDQFNKLTRGAQGEDAPEVEIE